MSNHADRLLRLRAELGRHRLDGFVVPSTDEHLSEYVGTYAKRLGWLTGFRGSAGTAVVLPESAAIFVDGRYTLQARQQVDPQCWTHQSTPHTTPAAWLGQHAQRGTRIGYDPWLHTRMWVDAARAALRCGEVQLLPVDGNPIDAIWADRPRRSDAKLRIHAEAFAGRPAVDKRAEVARWLATVKADATLLCALDSIAWTFNVRGGDISHTPVALAYALLHADGAADLFVDPGKLTDEVVAHLGLAVRLHPYDALPTYLAGMRGKTVTVDPNRTVVAITDALEKAGASVLELRDPVMLPKAIKNDVEIAGHRSAQLRDGAALCRFLHWLATQVACRLPRDDLSELSAAARLREFRQYTNEFCDVSFETISASGRNGAIVHYYATADTNRLIEADTLYLVDSGAQYVDGTTDVTRTVATGAASGEMRERFTRVLKGHIALARAVFPEGTRGIQIDALARQYLWAAGIDYAHGTGHGIGSYLDVHEGPQLIHSGLRADEPLRAGMIVSNEPGYYKAGHYGIRIENLMLVVRREIDGAERPMLGFETLTFAPIDRDLIELAMLTSEERAWLDDYHADVARSIGPQLTGAAKDWLMQATCVLN